MEAMLWKGQEAAGSGREVELKDVIPIHPQGGITLRRQASEMAHLTGGTKVI